MSYQLKSSRDNVVGFQQGGMAGHGLRRQLLDEQPQPKGEPLARSPICCRPKLL